MANTFVPQYRNMLWRNSSFQGCHLTVAVSQRDEKKSQGYTKSYIIHWFYLSRLLSETANSNRTNADLAKVGRRKNVLPFIDEPKKKSNQMNKPLQSFQWQCRLTCKFFCASQCIRLTSISPHTRQSHCQWPSIVPCHHELYSANVRWPSYDYPKSPNTY